MRRHETRHEMRHHRVKREKVDSGKYDLTHYVNDRVELLRKVFTILKPSEINCMLPGCVRDLSLDNVQELCLEELLGISDRRLYTVLEGTDPPSDTSSSSEELGEKVSLDSISSGEVEPPTSSKSKKKKRCKRKEDKRKRSKKSDKSQGELRNVERSGGEGAGLTVLELLELQARARAIRAQLVVEQNNKVMGLEKAADPSTTVADDADDDDDVLIKEEPREVVELISSDDEKPDLEELKKAVKQQPDSEQPEATMSKPDSESTSTVTKRNDLTIIVPKQTTKKIKLNRTRYTATNNTQTFNTTDTTPTDSASTDKQHTSTDKQHTDVSPSKEHTSTDKQHTDVSPSKQYTSTDKQHTDVSPSKQHTSIDKQHTDVSPSKQYTSTDKQHTDVSTSKQQTKNKRKKRKLKSKDGSDDDEIKLQLSDSERQDLLEYLDDNTRSQHSLSEYSSDTSDTDNTHTKQHTHSDGQHNIKTDCQQQPNVVVASDKIEEPSTSGSDHKENTDRPVIVSETGEKCVTSDDNEIKGETVDNTEVN